MIGNIGPVLCHPATRYILAERDDAYGPLLLAVALRHKGDDGIHFPFFFHHVIAYVLRSFTSMLLTIAHRTTTRRAFVDGTCETSFCVTPALLLAVACDE